MFSQRQINVISKSPNTDFLSPLEFLTAQILVYAETVTQGFIKNRGGGEKRRSGKWICHKHIEQILVMFTEQLGGVAIKQ